VSVWRDFRNWEVLVSMSSEEGGEGVDVPWSAEDFLCAHSTPSYATSKEGCGG
jgi:hypothetical protein